jgi:HEAT repeat protein
MPIEQVPQPSAESFDQLLRDLNHRVWEIRRNACEELGTGGDPRGVPYLIRLLGDGVGAVRFSAAEALGKLGDRQAIPPLLALLDNEHFGAYGPVIEALGNLRSTEAIPYFIRFLRDADPRVRSLAANALMVMTRQFISFKPKGPEAERNAAIQQWETWWEKNRSSYGQ